MPTTSTTMPAPPASVQAVAMAFAVAQGQAFGQRMGQSIRRLPEGSDTANPYEPLLQLVDKPMRMTKANDPAPS